MAMHFDLVDLRLMVHIADANSMTRGAELSFISLPSFAQELVELLVADAQGRLTLE
jgi:hypothetical protein